MDDWKELKKIAEELFKSLEYEQAAKKYIEASQNLMDSYSSNAKNDNSERDSLFGRKNLFKYFSHVFQTMGN